MRRYLRILVPVSVVILAVALTTWFRSGDLHRAPSAESSQPVVSAFNPSPSPVSPKQLEEIYIKTNVPKKAEDKPSHLRHSPA